ncbi:MAG: T9SS type A sorting domain-containing protein [Dysgonamonadaceae bacterium]|jgi:hypothetical protein|nr:T9SS type A sorting domain-containing protein [Dysgonamonadaceae bacterium]
MKQKLTIIKKSALVVLLAMSAQLLLAQVVTISQWNGFTPNNPPANGIFKATGGISYNNNVAELKRDATVTSADDYRVNADGVAASAFWNNTASDGGAEKYWIATFVTTGYENLTVTSKQMGSNTGPRDFKLQYRVGTTGSWTDVTGGTITVANDNYVIGVLTDLTLPATMENQASVSLRWFRTSTTSIGGANIGGGGINRLDVVVKGTAKTGVVDPKITTSVNSLRFFNKNQVATFTVTAENLTSGITVTSSNPSVFIVDPTTATLPAGATNATVKVMFSGTTNATGTLTLTSGVLVKPITLTAVYMPSGNNGTETKPFTVYESTRAQGAANNTDYYWVKAYIVGVSDGGATFTPVFTPPFGVASNLILASDPEETANEDLLPVQLLINTAVRTNLNLQDNPANLGKYVKIEGTLEPYFGKPGLKNARAYQFLDPSDVKNTQLSSINVYCASGILNVENLTERATIQVYDIAGKLIVSTQETKISLAKGLYIVKINTQAFKVSNN